VLHLRMILCETNKAAHFEGSVVSIQHALDAMNGISWLLARAAGTHPGQWGQRKAVADAKRQLATLQQGQPA